MSDVILATGCNVVFCPQCDYALTGLPTDGKCPECGFAYDQNFLIRRGIPSTWPEGRPEQGGWSWLFAGRNRVDAVIWMHPQGVGRQFNVDPSSSFLRWSRWADRSLWVFVGLLSVYALVLLVIKHRTEMAISVLVWTVIVAATSLWKIIRRRKFALPPNGLQPGLFAWNSFAQVNWQPHGNRNYRLRLVESSNPSAGPFIELGLRLGPKDARFVAGQIEAWTGSRFRVLPLNPGSAMLNRTAKFTGKWLRKTVIRPDISRYPVANDTNGHE